MKKDKRSLCILILICVVISFAVCCIVKIDRGWIKKNGINDEDIYSGNDVHMYVEQENSGEDYGVIRAWCFLDNVVVDKYDMSIGLLDRENEICYILPTQMEKREDVGKEYQLDDNTENCGLLSRFNSKKIPNNKNLNICIYYNNDDSGRYIITGWSYDEGVIVKDE